MRTAKFLVLALTTCSVIGLAQKVKVNPATAVDFSKFKTFSIRNASVTNTIFWLNNATVRALAGVGYTEVSGSQGPYFGVLRPV